MCKISLPFFSLLCIIAAQSATANNWRKVGTPNLTCIAFGDSGCRIKCSVLADIYKKELTSDCNDNKKCVCRNTEGSLDTLWEQNVQQDEVSAKLLKDIRENEYKTDKVLQILREFPRTPQEHIAKMKRTFPNVKGFKKLQPAETDIPADHFASKPDIDDTIQQSLAKISRSEVENIDYVDNMKKFIKKDLKNKKNWRRIVRKHLCQVDNATTKKMIKKYFTNKKCKPKPYDRMTHKVEIAVAKELLEPKSHDKNDQ